MTQECQSTAAYNEALVRPRQGVQAAPTCNEALIRPLQGCQATPTYKEALIRPPPVKFQSNSKQIVVYVKGVTT